MLTVLLNRLFLLQGKMTFNKQKTRNKNTYPLVFLYIAEGGYYAGLEQRTGYSSPSYEQLNTHSCLRNNSSSSKNLLLLLLVPLLPTIIIFFYCYYHYLLLIIVLFYSREDFSSCYLFTTLIFHDCLRIQESGSGPSDPIWVLFPIPNGVAILKGAWQHQCPSWPRKTDENTKV